MLRPLALLLALALPLGACASGAGQGGAETGRAAEPARSEGVRLGDDRRVDVRALGADDRAYFRQAWQAFLTGSPMWPVQRRNWLSRGEAAPYVLAENLFAYFWAVSFEGRADEVERVAREAAHIGEPAVAYFAKPLTIDRIRLSQPMRVKSTDQETGETSWKQVEFLTIDDPTRRDAATVLAAIGPPSVPTLLRPEILRSDRPASRRYAALALGEIGTDDAVDALEDILVSAPTWEERAAAVQGLGEAIKRNPLARTPLEAATRDPDPFVRRKAAEALR